MPVRPTTLSALSALTLALAAGSAHALPTLSQVGNLLSNGNFESGSATPVSSGVNVAVNAAFNNWRQYANSSGTTSAWVNTPLIEGLHTAELWGGANDGLYQYRTLSTGTYTVSGWVNVLSGGVHLGLAWNSGGAAGFGTTATAGTGWQYLSYTRSGIPGSLGGALVYAAAPGSHYYAEGLWLNQGATSTSPFAPTAGFNPSAVPEPGTWATLALGGLALAALRRRARAAG